MRAKNVCLLAEDGLLTNERSDIVVVRIDNNQVYIVRRLRDARNSLGAASLLGQTLLTPESTSLIDRLLGYDVVAIVCKHASPLSTSEEKTIVSNGARLCIHRMGERQASYDDVVGATLVHVEKLAKRTA